MLESKGLDVGIVTNVVGITRIEIDVAGQPDHAGTTPMDMRRDALSLAAELALEIERLAARSPRAVRAILSRPQANSRSSPMRLMSSLVRCGWSSTCARILPR